MIASTVLAVAAQANDEPPMLENGLAVFDVLLGDLRSLLDRLWVAPACTRAQHGRGGVPKQPGIYLFTSADGHPLYVGQSRNLNRRLADHCQPGSDHNKASFAFNIAKKAATEADALPTGFRAAVAVHPDFAARFASAKGQVAAMPVRFVVESDPYLRTVFEVYATLLLNTKEFNAHETH
jgi:hypothetical protein